MKRPCYENTGPLRRTPKSVTIRLKIPSIPPSLSRSAMTTADTFAKTPRSPERFRLPDPPKREPDEMTSYDRLHKIGIPLFLARHFGNPETTLIEAERWVVPNPEFNKTRARRPDLLIAFGVSPDDYDASNGYIVSEQGKPPDFVMEIASESTADVDTGVKREYYAELGIPEYWRFDKTGQYHGARLAGDRLVDGQYEPIPIEEPEEGILQGYSAALNLVLRWEQGELRWHDPETGRHILTYDDQRAARVQERDRADTAETRADQERNRADQERAARVQAAARAEAAEARAEQLEAELRRLREGSETGAD